MLRALIGPEDATYQNAVWTSSSPKNLKIDKNGVATALAAGATSVTITCTSMDGHVSKQIKITVAEGDASQNTYQPFLYGDADGNGTVTAEDALDVLKSVVGLKTPDYAGRIAGCVSGNTDENGDPALSAADALQILQYVVHLTDHFQIEE